MIQRHIVLDLDPVSYGDSFIDVHVLAEVAVFSNRGARTYMRMMPYSGVLADLTAAFNDCGLVYKEVLKVLRQIGDDLSRLIVQGQ